VAELIALGKVKTMRMISNNLAEKWTIAQPSPKELEQALWMQFRD
jgi:hypothetical protein